METIYVETTDVGTIAGRLHPNPATAYWQSITRKWWATAPDRYRLFVSQLTIDECADGDPEAAKERLEIIKNIDLIEPSDEARSLAELLVRRLAVTATEPRDALHIAIAMVNRIQFIVTWNFKHILNPHTQ